MIDTLRQSNLCDKEFGKITQSISAFTYSYLDTKITLIDTPGHHSFSNMREKGSEFTDIVVIIISAMEGIMNQTIECIDLAKTYGVPIIFAINKIDICTQMDIENV